MSDIQYAVYILAFGLFSITILFFLLAAKKNDLEHVLKATQDTGVRGELFSVSLPDDKVAIAGVIMSTEESKRFFFEYKDGYQVILEHVGDVRLGAQTVEVFRRKPRTT